MKIFIADIKVNKADDGLIKKKNSQKPTFSKSKKFISTIFFTINDTEWSKFTVFFWPVHTLYRLTQFFILKKFSLCANVYDFTHFCYKCSKFRSNWMLSILASGFWLLLDLLPSNFKCMCVCYKIYDKCCNFTIVLYISG